MKLTLRLMGLAGAAIFGLALTLTFVSPIHVERAARGFIQSQLEREVGEGLEIAREEARQTRVGRLAEALADQHNEEIAVLKDRSATGLSAQIAAVVARMQDLSCECRQRMLQAIDAVTKLRLSRLERAEPQLRRIIEGRYGEIVADLLSDLRIFAATNLFAFLLLLILSFAKPGNVRQLFVPSVLLGGAAVAVSAIYLFRQDWFFTILYQDFVGWTYGVWLLLIYGLLCDIALLKAKVTTKVVDLVASAFGC